MNIRSLIEEKKQWRAHMARVKALSEDYQVVYKEIQKYLWKVGPVELGEGNYDVLVGVLELFEEGAMAGKSVMEVTGKDVAAFADDLIRNSKTFVDKLQESVDEEVARAMKKAQK